MKVITLTLNPAFDVHAVAPSFAIYEETIADIAETDSGGKGINLSRALTGNGVANTAVVVLGEENQDSFLRGLAPFHLTIVPISVPGRIRENITIHPEGDRETRLSFSGFSVDPSLIRDIEKAVGKIDSDTIITITGSNPKGLRLPDMKDLIAKWQGNGAKVVIDSRSFSPDDLLSCKPWLIKPNAPELSSYVHKDSLSIEEVRTIATDLHEKGISNVLVTLGGDGALLVNDEGTFRVALPKVDVRSTIGAGDSTIAGFISGFIKGFRSPDILRMAVSFGSAKCMREGTLPPLPEDVKKLFDQVTVTEL